MLLNILLWVGVLIISVLLMIWVSSKANGISMSQYFKLYGVELLIMLVVSIIIIVSMVGGNK